MAALSQLAELWQGKWDTAALEKSILEQIRPEDAEAAVSLLEERQESLKAKEMAVAIALKFKSAQLARKTLPSLYALAPQSALIAQVWPLIAEDDPVQAWVVAGQMHENFKEELLKNLFHTQEEREQLLPLLLEIDPELPELLITTAWKRGGKAGLELLLALEDTGWTPEDHESYYSVKRPLLLYADLFPPDESLLSQINWEEAKENLPILEEQGRIEEILQFLMDMEAKGLVAVENKSYVDFKLELLKLDYPQTIKPSFFAGIATDELFALAMDWHLYLWGTDYYPLETIITLLDYLGKAPQYCNRSLLLKAVADPPSEPEPGKIFSREQFRRLEYLHSCDVSPGGRQVLYSDNKTYWFDMDRQKHIGEFDEPLYGIWDPDSDRVALIPSRQGDKLYLCSTDTAAVLAEFPWNNPIPLGWQDGCLLLAQDAGTGYQVIALDPAASGPAVLAETPVCPSLSPGGKLGYIIARENSLLVVAGDKEMNYTGDWVREPWELYGWLPQDRGLVLRKPDNFALLYFQDGKFIPLEIEGLPIHPQGWLDENRFAGTIRWNSPFRDSVFIFDLRNMSWEHSGIRWYGGDGSHMEYGGGKIVDNMVCRFKDGNLEIFFLK